MEESKKKPIMIGVIIVCFLLAGVIAYKYSFSTPEGSGTAVFKGQLVWVKCSNTDCEAAYQIDKKGYFDSIEELVRQNPMAMETPPLVCEKCAQESIYRAEKCEKCGIFFFRGASGRGELSDKCPECGHSPMEELRKRAREGALQGG